MDLRDIVLIGAIGFGVLMLKGAYDSFVALNIPLWMLFLVVFLVVMLGILGLAFLMSKRIEESTHVSGIQVQLGLMMAQVKFALRSSARFWLNWPAWVFMILLGKLLEFMSLGWARSLAGFLSISLEAGMPVIGSPLAIASLALASLFLIVASAPLFLVAGLFGRDDIVACPKCGSLHTPADNYCSNCGARIPKRRF